MRAAGEYHLVAIRPIIAGERLFLIEGEMTVCPTRHSVQIEEHLHIDFVNVHSVEAILDRYFWRFMNHSCDSNTLVCGREVIALRNIDPWQAVTFNYNTTEWDMAEPFICRCGVTNCLKEIRGFKHLTLIQREQLPKVAPYLNRRALREQLLIAEPSSA